tara:strand:- start:5152 stop:6366 length:1215 start_codon:yes stop_codon:yes gene_type:complete
MRRFILFIKLVLRAKFIFKNPQKYEVVVFDDESMVDFKNFIHHYNFFTLQSRPQRINKIYFSFKILKFFIKNYNGNIMLAYFVSLLEIIGPKVVLTNIDNSLKFFELAKTLEKKMIFVAIQNAARYDLKIYKQWHKKKMLKTDMTKNFYIPNFFCFGQLEIDDYRQREIKVKNFFKVGSLRLANGLNQIKKEKINTEKIDYDVCLLSEASRNYDKIFGETYTEKGAADLAKYTIKFCIKNEKKFIFAQKRDQVLAPEANKKELNFYKKYLSDEEYNYLIKNSWVKKNNMNASYIAMLRSKMSVGYVSTMLRENLALGGKSLNCNLTKTDLWEFPIKGICNIENCSFEEFEERMLQILSMSKDEYFSKVEKDKCYAVEFDEKNSTIDIIKEKIDYFLNNKNLQIN